MLDHWGRVRDDFTENFKNDLSWLVTLRGTKVRDSLKNWGYIASDRCAVCDRKESIDHCFLNCRRSRAVWEHFAPLLSKLIKASFPINILTIFFFDGPLAIESLTGLRTSLLRLCCTPFGGLGISQRSTMVLRPTEL